MSSTKASSYRTVEVRGMIASTHPFSHIFPSPKSHLSMRRTYPFHSLTLMLLAISNVGKKAVSFALISTNTARMGAVLPSPKLKKKTPQPKTITKTKPTLMNKKHHKKRLLVQLVPLPSSSFFDSESSSAISSLQSVSQSSHSESVGNKDQKVSAEFPDSVLRSHLHVSLSSRHFSITLK